LSYSMGNRGSFLWHRRAMAWNTQRTWIWYQGEKCTELYLDSPTWLHDTVLN